MEWINGVLYLFYANLSLKFRYEGGHNHVSKIKAKNVFNFMSPFNNKIKEPNFLNISHFLTFTKVTHFPDRSDLTILMV